MARTYAQGLYTVRNPQKYIGDPTKVRYMSSWEANVHAYFDNNPQILRWGSEVLAIPYVHPVDNEIHRYYPDYYIEYKNTKGELVKEIIEVKPEKQINRPTTKGKSKKTQLTEAITYAINQAKWQYATAFCLKHGLKFRVINEHHIFGTNK